MIDTTEIEEALTSVSNCDRDTWLRMGMAIKSELSDAGFDIWNQWSQSDDTYDERDARAVWKSFNGSGVTIKSLFKEAIDNGYEPPKSEIGSDNCYGLKIGGSTKPAPADVAEHPEARRQWDAATAEPGNHKYLESKGIKAHGIRTNGYSLLVPVRDSSGTLCGLQTIKPDGSKKFIPGSKITGAYYGIGKPKDKLIIAEGFATGASIYEATGIATAIAFNCGNLKAVAEALRFKFDALNIIVAGDDDVSTKGNPGKKKAIEAAAAVGGKVAIVNFGDDRLDGATDFNDLAKHRGLDAVAEQINAATVPDVAHTATEMPTLSVLRADGIKPEAIDWLWNGYLARSMFHVMAGRAGTGKTTLALSMAATISSGGKWPDGTKAEPGAVVMWTGEDAIAQTLIPRLKAMGADLQNIHFIDAVNMKSGRRSFDPAVDIDLLDDQLGRIPNVQLLIIDPIVSAVTASSGENGSTRRDLQPLVDLGSKRDCVVLGITHFSKGTKGRDPLERVTGSLAYGAFARIVFGTGKATEEGDPNIFARIKSNVGPDGGGFEYAIAIDEIEPNIIGSRISWGTQLEGDAREILGACEAEESSSDQEDAEFWLKSELEDGPVGAKELQKAARDAGHQWHTVKRARHTIGAETEKSAFQGGWRWFLPKGTTTEGDSSRMDVPLGDSKHLKPAPDNTLSEGNMEENNCSLGPRREHESQPDVPFDETRTTPSFKGDLAPEGNNDAKDAPLAERF